MNYFVPNVLHPLNTYIGDASVLQKHGFFMVLVCWLSYLNQAFWLSYVTHGVLLSASYLIPPQGITKEEL